jgi:hypothetical protein
MSKPRCRRPRRSRGAALRLCWRSWCSAIVVITASLRRRSRPPDSAIPRHLAGNASLRERLPMFGDMPSNFGHLKVHDQQLVRLGMLAERYFSDDPNTCLLKLRQLTELLAQLAASKVGIYTSPDEKQVDLLRRLQDKGIVPREVGALFAEVRKAGNDANHCLSGDHRTALLGLRLSWQLGVWFHRTFKDPAFKSGPFQPPAPPAKVRGSSRFGGRCHRRRRHWPTNSLPSQRTVRLASHLPTTSKPRHSSGPHAGGHRRGQAQEHRCIGRIAAGQALQPRLHRPRWNCP